MSSLDVAFYYGVDTVQTSHGPSHIHHHAGTRTPRSLPSAHRGVPQGPACEGRGPQALGSPGHGLAPGCLSREPWEALSAPLPCLSLVFFSGFVLLLLWELPIGKYCVAWAAGRPGQAAGGLWADRWRVPLPAGARLSHPPVWPTLPSLSLFRPHLAWGCLECGLLRGAQLRPGAHLAAGGGCPLNESQGQRPHLVSGPLPQGGVLPTPLFLRPNIGMGGHPWALVPGP